MKSKRYDANYQFDRLRTINDAKLDLLYEFFSIQEILKKAQIEFDKSFMTLKNRVENFDTEYYDTMKDIKKIFGEKI